MWSVGCIFYELLTTEPLLSGKVEMEQLEKMFRLLGTPKLSEWPEFTELPHAKRWDFLKKQYPYVICKFFYLALLLLCSHVFLFVVQFEVA